MCVQRNNFLGVYMLYALFPLSLVIILYYPYMVGVSHVMSLLLACDIDVLMRCGVQCLNTIHSWVASVFEVELRSKVSHVSIFVREPIYLGYVSLSLSGIIATALLH